MSCIPFDIQKSNWLLQNYPMPKLVKHAIVLFFPPIEGTFLFKKQVLDTNVNIGASSIDFPQIAWIDDF